MSVSESRPVLVIDGSLFTDFEGFAVEFSKLLTDHTWNGNLDAFDDILYGGFGTPTGGLILRWEHSDASRAALGPTLFDEVVEIIELHGGDAANGVHLELR